MPISSMHTYKSEIPSTLKEESWLIFYFFPSNDICTYKMLLKYILKIFLNVLQSWISFPQKETFYAYRRPFTPTRKRPFKGVNKV
jgi:hypothetical protein